MSPDKIFSAYPPVAAALGELREGSRDAYRAAVAVLAGRRKLRPAFIDKKPLAERHAWMAAELAKKSNADVAAEVLQGWLFACRKPMMAAFLDSLGAPHEDALIENLPPEPPRDKIEAAVSALLDSHPAWAVAAYLNLFVEMDIAEWPSLRGIVESDPRLQPANPPANPAQ